MYPNDPGLQEGMILSDEPGYYEEWKKEVLTAQLLYGLRDEQVGPLV